MPVVDKLPSVEDERAEEQESKTPGKRKSLTKENGKGILIVHLKVRMEMEYLNAESWREERLVRSQG